MPVHDWTRVHAGIFHDFHCTWTTHIKEALNEGLLPNGYYALTEQSVPVVRPDVIALATVSPSNPRPRGGTAVMGPPSTKVSLEVEPLASYR